MKCWVVALCLAFVAGCNGVQPAADAERVTRDIQNTPFDDTPAPKEARYENSAGESFSYVTPSFRCGKFHYSYAGSATDAAGFYKATWAKAPYSWTLVDEDKAGENSVTLRFEKGEDTSAVHIDREAKKGVRIVVRVNYQR